MGELCYCQYAFAAPTCRVQEIGPGLDPRFHVELVREGSIAALVSRVSLDAFSPKRLQGKTAEDVRWLGKVAARHNEVICKASASSPVLPLRLGTVFRSRQLLRAMLVRCETVVARFLQQLGNRQEWRVKLFLDRPRRAPIPGHLGPPPPHFLTKTDAFRDGKTTAATGRRAKHAGLTLPATLGTAFVTQEKAQLDSHRKLWASIDQTIQHVEERLAGIADMSCRIRSLPSYLTGCNQEAVYNAAFLLPASARARWLETIQSVDREVRSNDLVLEISGPWPPYHFCPSLESD